MRILNLDELVLVAGGDGQKTAADFTLVHVDGTAATSTETAQFNAALSYTQSNSSIAAKLTSDITSNGQKPVIIITNTQIDAQDKASVLAHAAIEAGDTLKGGAYIGFDPDANAVAWNPNLLFELGDSNGAQMSASSVLDHEFAHLYDIQNGLYAPSDRLDRENYATAVTDTINYQLGEPLREYYVNSHDVLIDNHGEVTTHTNYFGDKGSEAALESLQENYYDDLTNFIDNSIDLSDVFNPDNRVDDGSTGEDVPADPFDVMDPFDDDREDS
jgi:hypothetical protein